MSTPGAAAAGSPPGCRRRCRVAAAAAAAAARCRTLLNLHSTSPAARAAAVNAWWIVDVIILPKHPLVAIACFAFKVRPGKRIGGSCGSRCGSNYAFGCLASAPKSERSSAYPKPAYFRLPSAADWAAAGAAASGAAVVCQAVPSLQPGGRQAAAWHTVACGSCWELTSLDRMAAEAAACRLWQPT